MNDFLHDIGTWLYASIGWVVISLSAGTLLALHRGASGTKAWMAVLIKSLLVGLLVAQVVPSTELAFGVQVVLVASFSFGADAILALLDRFWQTAASNPSGTGRTVIRWLAGRSGITADEHRRFDQAEVRRESRNREGREE